MRANFWISIALLLALPLAHAEEVEAEPTLELIELLGESDEEDSDIDIAISNIQEYIIEKVSLPLEVKNDE